MARPSRYPAGGLSDGFVRWLDRIAEDGLVRMFWRWLTAVFGRRVVARKLIAGEEVISVSLHSWVAYVVPALIGLFGVLLGVVWLWQVTIDAAWFAFAVVLGIIGYSFHRILSVARDRFVITDSRVFRVWGVYSLAEAEMEIVRVLDITVKRPWYLRLAGSGHLILENAAQEQGLRKIHLIPEAQKRAMEIHRRRRQMLGLAGDEDSATPPLEKETPRSQHPRKPRPVTARRYR